MAGNYPDVDVEEINVEEIMKNIRDSVKNKKTRGGGAFRSPAESATCWPASSSVNLDYYLSRLNSTYDTGNYGYSISSHRNLIGPLLVRGRNLVYGEVRRYVDPVIQKQTGFNLDVIHAIKDVSLLLNDQLHNDLDERISETRSHTEELLKATESQLLRTIDEKTFLAQKNAVEIQKSLEEVLALKAELDQLVYQYNNRLSILFSKMGALEDQAGSGNLKAEVSEPHGASGETATVGHLYLMFENTFRGSESEIRERQSYYQRYFPKGGVLDIGSGRGEFLELLKESSIRATGVDLNADLVAHCKNKGLDVVYSDGLSYLESVEDGSLNGVFMAQIIEHIETADIERYFGLIYRKLSYGSYLVVETINIQNSGALSNFYLDPTHKRPVHPLYLEFLAKCNGYRDIEIVYRVYDRDITGIPADVLKSIAPDYAVVCRK